MDALDKATLAAEVPMVVSGADQVEISGSAVEETPLILKQARQK